MEKFDVFDFDGTIYKKDCSMEFWKFCLKKDKMVLLYFPIQLSGMILKTLKIIKTKKLKELFFSFLNRYSEKEILEKVDEFWEEEKKNICNWYIEKPKLNYRVCISASPKFILEKITTSLAIDELIATDMPINGKDKNKIIGNNCKGEEKVTLLKEKYKEFIIEEFYTDSKVDMPLCDIAQKYYFVKNGELVRKGEEK